MHGASRLMAAHSRRLRPPHDLSSTYHRGYASGKSLVRPCRRKKSDHQGNPIGYRVQKIDCLIRSSKTDFSVNSGKPRAKSGNEDRQGKSKSMLNCTL
jgi:hypothetical protein